MVSMFEFVFAVGLLQYCNFGAWSAKEDEQLKKNFANIAKVCITVISTTVPKIFSRSVQLFTSDVQSVPLSCFVRLIWLYS